MKFSECMLLQYNEDNNIISIQKLKKILPNYPNEVLQDFLSDHGREPVFQKQFGHLELNNIHWTEILISAKDILLCKYYNQHKSWIDSVGFRLDKWEQKSWNCIDARQDIVSHWENNYSWKRSPIFLCGSLMQCERKYYLAEGHTRFGLLKGLVAKGILSSESKHTILLGQTN